MISYSKKIALTTFRLCFELAKKNSYLTLRGAVIRLNISFQIFTADTPELTSECEYEVSVVSLISDLCYASIAAVLYGISDNVELHHGSTWL